MRTKYNNKKIVLDGITFDSKEEGLYYEHLKRRRASGEIINYELQPRYVLQEAFKRDGKTIRAITYTPDFLVYHLDGSEEAVDVKGMSTQQGVMRRKMFLYRYPEIKLTWIARSLKYGDAEGWIEYDELTRLRRKAKAGGNNRAKGKRRAKNEKI